MTSTPAATSEMDDLDQLGAKAFNGFLVRKDLVRKYSRQFPVPTYVVEFLLGRHRASTDPTEIEAGLQIVNKQRPDRRRAGARQRAQRPAVQHRCPAADSEVQPQRAGDLGQGPSCLHNR